MGRVKLKIKRLESTSNRQVTYSKRRNGILKKAKELSILCDIDVALLMFCPTGRPTLFHGRHSIEDIIAKFALLPPQERAKRKLESLEALKKTFKKLDHDVNIKDFLGVSAQTAQEFTNQVRLLQAQITQVQKRLSYWSNPDRVDSVLHLRQMEDSLKESINQIRMHKENFGKCQVMPLECHGQNEMSLPSMMNGMQEAKSLSWVPNNGSQPMIFFNEENFWHRIKREVECSNIASLPDFSGYHNTIMQTEIGNLAEIHNMGHEGGTPSNFSSDACLGVQLDEQFSYPPPYSSLNMVNVKEEKSEEHMSQVQLDEQFSYPPPSSGLNMVDIKKEKSEEHMSQVQLDKRFSYPPSSSSLNIVDVKKEKSEEHMSQVQLDDEQFSYPPYSSLNLVDVKEKPEEQMSHENIYQVNGKIELPRPVLDNGNHSWVTAAGPCSVAMFNGNPYKQES